jgi:single-strand DNA-binding protein
MNKVLLVGRLVNDPRFTTGKSSGATFATLACEGEFNWSKGKKEVDFIDITIFGKQAEFVANYTRKGDLISVEGSLKNSDYMKDGKKVYKTSVIVSKVDKLASVKGGDSK